MSCPRAGLGRVGDENSVARGRRPRNADMGGIRACLVLSGESKVRGGRGGGRHRCCCFCWRELLSTSRLVALA